MIPYMTLTEFLLARIAEERESALTRAATSRSLAGQLYPTRAIAACDAKRRIVERCSPVDLPNDGPDIARTAWDAFNVLNKATLRDLAAIYADHIDYRDEWRA